VFVAIVYLLRVLKSTAMPRFCILIVDDQERILNLLGVKLEALGYEVVTASDGVAALEQAQAQEPDLIVLDLLMPGMDGFETLKGLRAFSDVPVIILSAKGADAVKIKSLQLGADDYLQKPFNPDELVARIESIRRRIETAVMGGEPTLRICSVDINFAARRVLVSGEDTPLTRIEWLLLSELSRNIGCPITHGELLTNVWGPEYRDDVEVLRAHISRLRRKLEKGTNGPRLIRSVPKFGYMMELPSGQEV
jgi:two-component system KDP operon response regulator KdpE